jgi:hypothetical protein
MGSHFLGTAVLGRSLVLATMLVFAGSSVALAAVSTDKADYAPGSVVTISGDNSNGAGYLAGETVDVSVSGPNGYSAACWAVADDTGAWSCQVTLWNNANAIGDYSYTATGRSSGVSEVGFFSDAWGTTTALSSSLNPAGVGQSVTFTATVTYAGNGSGSGSPAAGSAVTIGGVRIGTGANCAGGFTQLASGAPNTSGVFTYTTSALPAGSHTIRACYDGTGGQGTGDSSATLGQSVNAAAAATTLAVPAVGGTFGGTVILSATLTLTASGTTVSGKTVSFSLNGDPVGTAVSNGSGVATLNNVSLTGVNAGGYPGAITASFAGDATHAASSGAATLTVNQAGQAITFTSSTPAAAKYGDTYAPSATGGNSGNPVTFGASGACSYSAGAVTMSGVGSCTVSANQAGNANHGAAPQVTQVFSVGKATLSVNAVASSKTYGDGDPAFSWTLSGFEPGDDATNAGITGSATCTRTPGETVAGSPYTITCAPGTLAAANYDFTTGTTADFTVDPMTVTVTPDSGQGKFVGAPEPTLTFSNDGGLVAGAFSGALERVAGETAGLYAIDLGTLSAGENYVLQLASTTVYFLVEVPEPPTITISSPSDGQVFVVGSVVAADYSCTAGDVAVDECAGDVPDGANLDTASVGWKTFTVVARDASDNVLGSESVTYRVIYPFEYLEPTMEAPDPNTPIVAGTVLVVRFHMSGWYGPDVLRGWPRHRRVDCDTLAPLTRMSTGSLLHFRYNATKDVYRARWQTRPAWAGTCRQFIVRLKDDMNHVANYTFTVEFTAKP